MSEDEEVGGYASIPRAIQRDPSISAAAKLVYLALSSRANAKLRCHPAIGRIAAEASISPSAAKRALQELRKLGYIHWVNRPAPGGGRNLTSNEYRLYPDGGSGHTEPTPGSVRTGGSGQTDPVTIEERTIEVEEEHFIVDAVSGERVESFEPGKRRDVRLVARNIVPTGMHFFEEFWAIYPRKTGKRAAEAAYKQARLRGVSPSAILAGATRYANDPNLPEKTFIPHPATWLNGGRWEDEPEPARSASASRGPQRTPEEQAIIARIGERNFENWKVAQKYQPGGGRSDERSGIERPALEGRSGGQPASDRADDRGVGGHPQ